MKAVYLVLAVLLVSVSSALVQAYSVDPVKSAWSGWTPWLEPNNYVSQIITCNFDELDSASGGYVELFVGENGGNGTYNVEVKDGATRVAYQLGKAREGDYAWLKFSDIQMEPGESFTKGKQYEFRFSRSGADSIECAVMTNV